MTQWEVGRTRAAAAAGSSEDSRSRKRSPAVCGAAAGPGAHFLAFLTFVADFAATSAFKKPFVSFFLSVLSSSSSMRTTSSLPLLMLSESSEA